MLCGQNRLLGLEVCAVVTTFDFSNFPACVGRGGLHSFMQLDKKWDRYAGKSFEVAVVKIWHSESVVSLQRPACRHKLVGVIHRQKELPESK